MYERACATAKVQQAARNIDVNKSLMWKDGPHLLEKLKVEGDCRRALRDEKHRYEREKEELQVSAAMSKAIRWTPTQSGSQASHPLAVVDRLGNPGLRIPRPKYPARVRSQFSTTSHQVRVGNASVEQMPPEGQRCHPPIVSSRLRSCDCAQTRMHGRRSPRHAGSCNRHDRLRPGGRASSRVHPSPARDQDLGLVSPPGRRRRQARSRAAGQGGRMPRVRGPRRLAAAAGACRVAVVSDCSLSNQLLGVLKVLPGKV